MTVYHIYKANCFASSRVMLQAGWDKQSVFVHPAGSKSKKQDEPNIKSIDLTLFNLLVLLRRQRVKRKSVLIFHAQSSLPFLALVRTLTFPLPRGRLTLVYDMHDLLERSASFSDYWHYIRYGLIRHKVLKWLEYFIFNDKAIKKITVSRGLADIVSGRYKCEKPTVVYSASFLTPSLQVAPNREYAQSALLYFGTKKHLPVDLIDDIALSGLKLHLYGKDINLSDFNGKILPSSLESLKVFGEYSPGDLKFLFGYNYLILYRHGINKLNYKHALPNKLFQGISAGLSLIVSENFEEIVHILSDIPGSVFVLKQNISVKQALDALESAKPFNYYQLIRERAKEFHDLAKSAYLNIVF